MGLEQEHSTVEVCHDGPSGLAAALGDDYDAIAQRMGCPVEEIRGVLEQLRQHLAALGIEHRPDEELPLAEAAARKGVSPKALAKRLRAGRLRGRKLGGEWLVMASEV